MVQAELLRRVLLLYIGDCIVRMRFGGKKGTATTIRTAHKSSKCLLEGLGKQVVGRLIYEVWISAWV